MMESKIGRGLVVVVGMVLAAGLAGCGPGEAPEPTAIEREPTLPSASLERTVEEIVLELEAQRALLSELEAEGLRVDTEITGGTVTLVGQVHDPATPPAAQEIVSALEGVNAVENQLVVAGVAEDAVPPVDKPESLGSELEDALLEIEVRLALYGAAGLEAQSINVEAAEGVVTVTGSVPTSEAKDGAISAIRSIDGVEDVIDGLQVLQPV